VAGGFFNQRASPPEMKALAEELQLLVDRMEKEVRDSGVISSDAAAQLKGLRHKMEQLLGRAHG
jgi:hypothetical protein